MILYILEVSIGWALFYLLYHLVLKNTTFFALNRWYLLSSFVVALFLPLLPPLWSMDHPIEPVVSEVVDIEMLLANLSYWQNIQVIEAETEQASTNWWLIVYWAGALIMIGRFLYGLAQIGRYFLKGKKHRKGIHRLVLTHKEHLPFSFFKWIFWGKHPSLETPGADRMLRHEEAHIRQGHTFDVVLVELVSAIAWFSPLVFFYRKALRSNHEFLADAAVTKSYRVKEYGHLLIQQSLSGPQIALVNHLIHSQLKNRIIMMTKKRSTRLSLLRYTLALPVIALLLMAFTYEKAYGLDEFPVFSDEFPEISFPSFTNENAEEVIPAEIFSVEENKKGSDNATNEIIASLPFLKNELAIKELNATMTGFQADTTKPKPLIVLNGKIMKEASIDAFPADQIKSVNVLKGKIAIEKYGNNGKNGVVEIDCPDCKVEKVEKKDKPAEIDFSDKLILLNSVEISPEEMQAIDPKDIATINIWKGEAAIKKYGDKGKNGVVEVICSECKTGDVDKDKTSIRIRGGEGEPLFVINGIVLNREEGDPAKDIQPDQIKSINVLKGESAIIKYGEKGENGVIEINCPSCKTPKAEKASSVRIRTNGIASKAASKITPIPLYILNDEKVDQDILDRINPNKIKSVTVLKDASAVEKYGEEAKNGVVIIECPKCKEKDLKKKKASELDGYKTEIRVRSGKSSENQVGPVFQVVEEMPVFQGCEDESMSREARIACSNKKLMEFIYNNIRYPVDKKLENVEGMVVAEFVVDKSGKVSTIDIRRSLGAEFDAAVSNVLEQMPRFKPGRQNGEKVNVKMTIPVRFKPLKDSAVYKKRQEAIKKQKELEKELPEGKTLKLQSFNATPNPTKGALHLRFQATPQNTLVRVLDASGKEIIREQLRNFNGLYDEVLDLSKAPKGMLLIHISQEDRQFVHKIVAQ